MPNDPIPFPDRPDDPLDIARLLDALACWSSIAPPVAAMFRTAAAHLRRIPSLEAEQDTLRRRLADMEVPDPAACAELLGFDVARREVLIKHWAVSILARSFHEFLGDAPNYRSVCIDLIHGEPGESGDPDDVKQTRMEVVVRRAGGKTPSELVGELRAVRDTLRQAAWGLSTWAATINWSDGGTNTSEWLDGLRERIERAQELARPGEDAVGRERSQDDVDARDR